MRESSRTEKDNNYHTSTKSLFNGGTYLFIYIPVVHRDAELVVLHHGAFYVLGLFDQEGKDLDRNC